MAFHLIAFLTADNALKVSCCLRPIFLISGVFPKLLVFIQTAFRAFFEHHLHSFSGQVATVHYCRVNNNNHQLGERLTIPNLSFPAKITFVSWI